SLRRHDPDQVQRSVAHATLSARPGLPRSLHGTPAEAAPRRTLQGLEPEELASGWLTLPELAAAIGQPLTKVRDWVREGRLVVVERGWPPVKSVPAEFVRDGELVKGLSGALTVLADAGYSADESLRWLLSDEPSLPGRPID